MKTYEISLPVFKKGDDLGHQLSLVDNDSAKALLNQAELYEEAARVCKHLAGVAAEGDLKIEQADTHFICVSGKQERLEALVKDEYLFSMDDDENEEDEDAEDEEDETEEDAEEDEEDEDGTESTSEAAG